MPTTPDWNGQASAEASAEITDEELAELLAQSSAEPPEDAEMEVTPEGERLMHSDAPPNDEEQ